MIIDDVMKQLKPNSKYKIWVHIEEINEEENHYKDLTDAQLVDAYSLGDFNTLQECLKFMINLPMTGELL